MDQLPPEPPKFVGGKLRCETITLDWPIEYDGKVYETVTVTRPNVGQIEAWRDRIVEAEAAGRSITKERLPMFDVPAAVLDFLDPDDEDRISEVATRFLPRRFRDDSSTGPVPSTGGSTPSS